MCDNVGMESKLWDGALAGLHVMDPDEELCNHTLDLIDKAIAHIPMYRY
jgi:hypothetical protein